MDSASINACLIPDRVRDFDWYLWPSRKMGRSIAIPVARNHRAIDFRLDYVDRLHRRFPQHAYDREAMGAVLVRFFLLALCHTPAPRCGASKRRRALEYLSMDQIAFRIGRHHCCATATLSTLCTQHLDRRILKRPKAQEQSSLASDHKDR